MDTSYAAFLHKTIVQSKKETCVASICTSAFKSDAEPPCGAASSTILDEGHRPSRRVHSFFGVVRVFLSGLVDSSAFHEVSLGREVSIGLTSNGPLVYRWEANKCLIRFRSPSSHIWRTRDPSGMRSSKRRSCSRSRTNSWFPDTPRIIVRAANRAIDQRRSGSLVSDGANYLIS